MSYSKKQFDRCTFNPLQDDPMVSVMSEIIDPTWETTYLDSLCRYVIMVYDPKSPLVINERDLNHRKAIAADMSGFDMTDEELLDTVYNCTHEYIVDLIIRYLIRFSKSKEFAAIVVFEQCFWESARKLMEPITGKDSKAELEAVQKKAAIKDEIDKDIKRLDQYWKTFFGEDPELEKRTKNKFSPEKMAALR